MVVVELTMSLDGFVAGPNATLEDPLGEGGEKLHEWLLPLKSFRERHGMDGGVDDEDSRLLAETVAANGAYVMGRRMFSGGAGPWSDDPNAGGWWGDDPPFDAPVFVVTHHAREPMPPFTFVTDGVEPAIERARAAAGEKVVHISGGADVAQQALRAGLVDELLVHVAPLLLGGGVRLFERVTTGVELVEVRGSAAVAHLRYRTA